MYIGEHKNYVLTYCKRDSPRRNRNNKYKLPYSLIVKPPIFNNIKNGHIECKKLYQSLLKAVTCWFYLASVISLHLLAFHKTSSIYEFGCFCISQSHSKHTLSTTGWKSQSPYIFWSNLTLATFKHFSMFFFQNNTHSAFTMKFTNFFLSIFCKVTKLLIFFFIFFFHLYRIVEFVFNRKSIEMNWTKKYQNKILDLTQ